ncbi:MAG: hypothetical protein HYW45_03460 [Candidatus Daviesbacteria bacterium]|nr:MAG: hypothetical protein HYW45_03460 [Candidatus Daviesbacteria bacterium]
MRKVFAAAFFIIGLILSLAGLGLITVSSQLLLYLGLVLVILSAVFFIRS